MNKNMCHRCAKEFARMSVLKKHLQRKYPCEFLIIDKNEIEENKNLEDEYEIIFNYDDYKFPEIETFDITEFFKVEYYSILLAAQRRSGKTTLLKSIYKDLLDSYDIVFFISYSLHNPIYDFITGPKLNVDHPGFFKDLIKFQKKTKGLFSICFITDDHLSMKNKNDQGLMKSYVAGRNSWISPIVSLQDATFLNKTSRGNTDYVILGNCSGEMVAGIVDKFLYHSNVIIPEFVETKSQKLDYLEKFAIHHTKDYNFIIIDNMNHKIYKYRVQL